MTRRILVALFALACGGARSVVEPSLEPGGRHVLFIGNSLTYTNDLPRTVADLAASMGDTIRVRAVARPDLALIDHLNGESDALAVLGAEPWDWVVLQQGPTSLAINRDTLVLATQRFDPHIRAAGARSAQLMTWPARAYRGGFPEVLGSSTRAARAVGGYLFPAGDAWRAAWEVEPTLALYGPDDYHPSPLGTYLAALVVYEGITGRDARTLPATPRVNGQPLAASETTIRLLQRIAHETALRLGAAAPQPRD